MTFIWKKVLVVKFKLILQYRQMKPRTHHWTQRSWRTCFSCCQWKNSLQFKIQTQIAKASPSTPFSQMMSPKFHLTILQYELNFTSRTFFQMKVKFDKECYTVILANDSLEIWIQKNLSSMQSGWEFKPYCFPYLLE